MICRPTGDMSVELAGEIGANCKFACADNTERDRAGVVGAIAPGKMVNETPHPGNCNTHKYYNLRPSTGQVSGERLVTVSVGFRRRTSWATQRNPSLHQSTKTFVDVPVMTKV